MTDPAAEVVNVQDAVAALGNLDVYLFDQLQRGRIRPGMVVLDAGCGSGRNIAWLLAAGYEVLAADRDSRAVASVREMAASVAPALPPASIRQESIEAMTFEDACADVVISSAVLHFAQDDADFESMLAGCWRVLKPGGLFFCRLASTIGMEERFRSLGGRRYALPDGSERYLVDAPMLHSLTQRLNGELVDPIKTTVVDDLRCMTTWVVRKNG